MVDTSPANKVYRPAEDISEDIAALIRRFQPLAQSRHWFTYTVAEGVVTVRGNIKSPVGARVLLDNLPDIPGVVAVNAADLHDDPTLRVAVGKLLPPGIVITIDFGRVVLSGQLPPRRKPEALIRKIEAVPGVRRVINQMA
jgi:osmotically-inducible protein OsmY